MKSVGCLTSLIDPVIRAEGFSELIRFTQRERRWRLQFGLRTLLFLGVPFAAVCIWFSAAYSSGLVEQEAAMWVRQQNGHVSYDYESPKPDGSYPKDAKPPATKFLRELLGIEFFSSVRCVILDNKFVTDLSALTRFRDLKVLAIYIDILPEADLSVLAELESLEILRIDYTNITARHSGQIELLKTALPNCTIELGPSVVGFR